MTGQSRLLVTKGASQAADMTQEEQRMKHLDKLKAVAESMASRDGSGLTDDYEFSLENQVSPDPFASGSPDSAAYRMGQSLAGAEPLGAKARIISVH